MKVVRETLLNKINKEISSDPESILRIELTIDEFIKLIQLLKESYTQNHITKIVLCGTERLALDANVLNESPDLISGSYIVYRGVCIQTHKDYA